MLAVPAFPAHTGAVVAVAVGLATVVALYLVAQRARPALVAHTALVLAVAVLTLQATDLCHSSTQTSDHALATHCTYLSLARV